MGLRAVRTAAWEPRHVDDIPLHPALNVVTAATLEAVLRQLPAKRRIHVAMAVVGLELGSLMVAADLVAPDVANKNTALWRWVSGAHRMPMGVGFRLARVFGVNAEVLCEGYI